MASAKKPTKRERELQARLYEAEETLRAIREGEVDAIVVSGSKGEQVFSLFGSESIYRLIVETMKEAAFTVSSGGQILYCNAQFSHFIEKSPEEIIGHSLHDFVTEADKNAVSSLLITSQRQPVKQRLVFRSVHGRPVPAHISATILNQPDEMSICVVASDLTDLENSTELIQQLRQQQAALRDSESRFKAVFFSSMDAILVTDDNGVYTDANPAAEKLFGIPHDELIGTHISRYMLPGYDFDNRWETFRQERSFQGETKVLRPSGQVIDTEMSASANILPGRHLAVIRDITERKRAEYALAESEKRYRTLFERIDEGFCILEMLFGENGRPYDWRYLEVNPAFERHNGLHEAVGKSIRELLPDIEERWFDLYGNVAITGEAVRWAEFSKAFNRWFDLYAFRVGEPEEHKVAVLFSDITRRKHWEEALQRTEERLRLALEAADFGTWDLDLGLRPPDKVLIVSL